jgi:glycosyltransferase involved in cell wall biosynthesis
VLTSLGVTCVICTHNGARRIEPTLACLAKQQVAANIPWEILVVDNASTDDLSDVLARGLGSNFIAPIRVVKEPSLGLSHARHRAFREAKYPIVSFIDDDVRVTANWVQMVADTMSKNPDCAALGGHGIGVFESPPPEWFSRHQERFVVGPQGNIIGDVTETERTLWGAGLTVRLEAVNRLIEEGFDQILVGRQGDQLTCGEDTELSLALRLAGWKIFYEPKLCYEHFLPATRVNWRFLRRWYRGYGAASLGFDPYLFARETEKGRAIAWYQKRWQLKVASTLFQIARRPLILLRAAISEGDDDDSIVWLEYQIGRLEGLLNICGRYDQQINKVVNGKWRRRLTNSTPLEVNSSSG